MNDMYLTWYRGGKTNWRLAMLRLGPLYAQFRVTGHLDEWRVWLGIWDGESIEFSL